MVEIAGHRHNLTIIFGGVVVLNRVLTATPYTVSYLTPTLGNLAFNIDLPSSCCLTAPPAQLSFGSSRISHTSMNDSDSAEPSLSTRIRSWFRTKPHASPTPSPNDPASTSTLNHSSIQGEHGFTESTTTAVSGSQTVKDGRDVQPASKSTVADNRSPGLPLPAPPPTSEKTEEVSPTSSTISSKGKLPMRKRFYNDCRRIIFCSWINWLLIFVPVGIIVGVVERVQGESSAISPTIVFSMNAIAIIPLASLLAFATESVATRMGDTIGALLNVTFGNAVELIVFIIALVANEIQIVQAAALGSILSNLLLILGMCFLFGGLRFREQVSHSSSTAL